MGTRSTPLGCFDQEQPSGVVSRDANTAAMSVNSRRTDRPLPEEPYSLSVEARGVTRAQYNPPLPVWAWVRFPSRDTRLQAVAVEASDDAVLVQWGRGVSERQCWVWRAGVKHRANDD